MKKWEIKTRQKTATVAADQVVIKQYGLMLYEDKGEADQEFIGAYAQGYWLHVRRVKEGK